ncbi:hypothetical protein BO71DRAFT_435543 [Aspergillus ellipticus CBS 707.79]|uniref:Uncharacterized protein n=1 Tax=Aspergillus ellipticus CBS 707.79 TaxID=1448320 RepID=A0A319DC58_9EURO|nr:hypothetical protein BO71DRAFT_435543 [Aspergillus ellipticus CBS 707.79]
MTAAAEYGHLSVLKSLLEARVEVSSWDTMSILYGIYGFKEGPEKLEGIFDRLRAIVSFTEYPFYGSCAIDDHFIKMAAKNERYDTSLVKLILNRYSTNLEYILTDFLKEIVKNTSCGQEILEMLLEQHDMKIELSRESNSILAIYAGRSPGTINLLLVNLTDTIKQEPHFMQKFAEFAILEVMESLIRTSGDSFCVTDAILSAATKNYWDHETLRLLLKPRGNQKQISNDILCSAAGARWAGSEYVGFEDDWELRNSHERTKIVLDWCGPDHPIDEGVMLMAVSHPHNGSDILKEFVNRQQAGFVVSDKVLIRAIKNSALETIQLLMANGGSDIKITDAILSQAGENNFNERLGSILVYLMGISGPEYTTLKTKAPVVEIISQMRKSGDYKALPLLLAPDLISADEQLVETFTRHALVLQILFRHNPTLPVTETVLHDAGTYDDLMRLVLDITNDNVTITEETVKVAIRWGGAHYETIGFCILMEQNRTLDLQTVWDGIWKIPCENWEIASETLLEYTKVEISENLLERVPLKAKRSWRSQEEYYRENLLLLAMKHDIPIPFQGKAMDIILESERPYTILMFLERNPHVVMTEDMVVAAKRHLDYYDLMWLLYSKLGGV